MNLTLSWKRPFLLFLQDLWYRLLSTSATVSGSPPFGRTGLSCLLSPSSCRRTCLVETSMWHWHSDIAEADSVKERYNYAQKGQFKRVKLESLCQGSLTVVSLTRNAEHCSPVVSILCGFQVTELALEHKKQVKTECKHLHLYKYVFPKH